MSKGLRVAAVAAGVLVAVIAVAGFFHGDRGVAAKEAPRVSMAPGEVVCKSGAYGDEKDSRTAWSLPTGGNYRRAAEFQLKVKDSIATDDELEKRAGAVGGTLLDLVLEGTDGARRGTISFKIPADKVNDFIKSVRELGKVQHERITAQQITGNGKDTGGVDEREFSLVRVHFWDEAVAPEMKESRGLFAASFEKSASHFLKGTAVLVELFGLLLPYAFAFGLVLAPVLIAIRMRRRAKVLNIEEVQA